jgi:hypothetical protein
MTQGTVNYVRAAACTCGPPPEQCVSDDEILTQHSWKLGSFADAPRSTELEQSMLRGVVTVADACSYRSGGVRVTANRIERAGCRQTTAGKLRAAGFAVVHTPGTKIKNGIHVSIVWPPDDPLDTQRTPWPPEVSERFAACFN